MYISENKLKEALKIGKGYIIYGKLEGMAKFKPIDTSNNCFVSNLIYADIFTMYNKDYINRFIKIIKDLNNQNNGIFKVKITY